MDLPYQTLIEIFDPKFYMYTEKSAVNPRLRMLIKEGYITYGNIKIEKFHLLKGKYQCSTDTDYSFTDCIQVSFIELHQGSFSLILTLELYSQ